MKWVAEDVNLESVYATIVCLFEVVGPLEDSVYSFYQLPKVIRDQNSKIWVVTLNKLFKNQECHVTTNLKDGVLPKLILLIQNNFNFFPRIDALTIENETERIHHFFYLIILPFISLTL